MVSDLKDQRSREWGGLSVTKEEIEALGRRSAALTADVADSGQVETMCDQVLDQFGQIAILVNNAGACAGPDRVPVVELDEAV